MWARHYGPFVSGRFVMVVATLDVLSFLEGAAIPASSTLLSKNPAHKSARDSLP